MFHCSMRFLCTFSGDFSIFPIWRTGINGQLSYYQSETRELTSMNFRFDCSCFSMDSISPFKSLISLHFFSTKSSFSACNSSSAISIWWRRSRNDWRSLLRLFWTECFSDESLEFSSKSSKKYSVDKLKRKCCKNCYRAKQRNDSNSPGKNDCIYVRPPKLSFTEVRNFFLKTKYLIFKERFYLLENSVWQLEKN